MVDPLLLQRKVATLGQRVERAKSKLSVSKDSFVADPDVHEIVAFNLFVAFQEAIDVAAHVIADAGWEVPATAREHFEVLARHGWMEAALATELGACAGARNLIAHAYGSLDIARLYDEAPAGISALERFNRHVTATVDPPVL